MGYYTGSGVVTSRTGDAQFLEKETVPASYLDGKPWTWRTDFYTQTTTTTTTTKNGVQMPSESDIGVSNLTFYNNGMIKTKTTKQAQRIGDSNLCTLVETTITNKVYRNGVQI